MPTAKRGVTTLVETTVAMALAQSCAPLVKSNTRATRTIRMSRRGISNILQHRFFDGFSQIIDVFQK